MFELSIKVTKWLASSSELKLHNVQLRIALLGDSVAFSIHHAPDLNKLLMEAREVSASVSEV